jgi:signal transduction histidine kinase
VFSGRARVARGRGRRTAYTAQTAHGRGCVAIWQRIALRCGRASTMLLATMSYDAKQPAGSGDAGKRRKRGRVTSDDALDAVSEVGNMFDQVRKHVADATHHLDDARGLLSHGSVLSAACVRQTQQALSEAAGTLENLSELVHASMQSRATSIGSTLLQRARPVTLGEAAQHACEVLLPVARKHGVTMDVKCVGVSAAEPARALYTVLLNVMTNAIEAVIARGSDPTSLKTVHVEIGPCPPPRVRGKVAVAGSTNTQAGWIAIEVTDDGVGLPGHIPVQRLCELGVSTKPGAGGVGLAVARSIVRGMGGELSISSRPSGTRGAMLKAVFPATAQVIRRSA